MTAQPAPRPLFDSSQLRQLLDELAASLDARGVDARIYLLGGAALALAYYDQGERALTQDVDAWYVPDDEVTEVVRQLAAEHDLPSDWLNARATLFVPAHGLPDGSVIIQRGGVRIEVAPARLLLAMKLRAARYGRDDDDIAVLLRRCAVTTVEAAEAVLDECFDGEERFKPHARDVVEAALGEYVVMSAIPPFTLPAVDAGDSNP